MRKPPRSSVISDGYRQAVALLKRDAPEAAAVFEANPPTLMKATHSRPPAATTPPHTTGPTPTLHPQPKGVVFTSPHFQGPAFPKGLARAVEAQGMDPSNPAAMADLGVRDFQEFMRQTKRALTLDPGHAVTPTKATGNYFELIGWEHPVIRTLRRDLFETYRAKVHAIAADGGPFRNGLFQPEKLRSPFDGPIVTMENTRLLVLEGGRETHGGLWVDRLDHVTNQHRQTLGIFGDLKAIASSKGLKEQVASLPPRLLAATAYGGENVFIEGAVSGKTKRIRLSQFVFPDADDAVTLSRIGVKATKGETRYGFETVNDTHGDPFIRMVLYCRTDKIWRIYVSLYRELGL